MVLNDRAPSSAVNQGPAVPLVAPEAPASAAQAQPVKVKNDDEETNGKPLSIQGPMESKTNDGDIQMTGISDATPASKEENRLNSSVDAEKVPESEKAAQPAHPETSKDDRSETIEVDSNTGKDISAPLTRRVQYTISANHD